MVHAHVIVVQQNAHAGMVHLAHQRKAFGAGIDEVCLRMVEWFDDDGNAVLFRHVAQLIGKLRHLLKGILLREAFRHLAGRARAQHRRFHAQGRRLIKTLSVYSSRLFTSTFGPVSGAEPGEENIGRLGLEARRLTGGAQTL